MPQCILPYYNTDVFVMPIYLSHSDGCGRTGSFITIYYTLERVKAEQTVDIFQAIKNSRIRRTGLVSNTVSITTNNSNDHVIHISIHFTGTIQTLS